MSNDKGDEQIFLKALERGSILKATCSRQWTRKVNSELYTE